VNVLSACLSACPSVSTITPERINRLTSHLVHDLYGSRARTSSKMSPVAPPPGVLLRERSHRKCIHMFMWVRQIGTPHDEKFNRACRRSPKGPYDLEKVSKVKFRIFCYCAVLTKARSANHVKGYQSDRLALIKAIKRQISNFLLLCSSD
jgi:hypothetical protein